jgi:hypothetical protein
VAPAAPPPAEEPIELPLADNGDVADRPRKKKKRKRANVRLIVGLSVGGALLVGLVLFLVIADRLGWISVLPSGTGEVSYLDVDGTQAYLHQGFSSERGVTLSDVEAKLGARGKRMSRTEMQETEFREFFNHELNLHPTCCCYRWSDGTRTVYLFFDGNVYTGGNASIGGSLPKWR